MERKALIITAKKSLSTRLVFYAVLTAIELYILILIITTPEISTVNNARPPTADHSDTTVNEDDSSPTRIHEIDHTQGTMSDKDEQQQGITFDGESPFLAKWAVVNDP